MTDLKNVIQVTFPDYGWIWVDRQAVTRVHVKNVLSLRFRRKKDVYLGDVKIKGFLNYIDRKWKRYYRRIDREANSTIWNGDDDVLDLSILFGEKIYEPEDWN